MRYIEFYVTRDRFEIYILLATGARVDGYDTDDYGRIYFRFESKEKCNRILAAFLSKKLKVYAHDMINAMRDAQAVFKSK